MFAVLAIVAIGLGFYALHLKRKVARDAQAAAEQQLIVAPSVNGPPEPVILYIANDSDGTLRKTRPTSPCPPNAASAPEPCCGRCWRNT